ncbi:MAG: tyrosine-protein phosphatase [Bacilli bacterium]|jgi:protein-tyrosine phosphatase
MDVKALVLSLAFSLTLFSCNQNTSPLSSIERYPAYEEEDFTKTNADEDDHEIKESEAKVSRYYIHTPLQYAFLNSSLNHISDFATGSRELSHPKGIKLSFSQDGLPALETNGNYHVQISLKDDFSNPKYYSTNTQNVTFKNLLLNTTYYWRASASFDFSASKIHSFTTESLAPRNLEVGGITNVRDCGGYESKYGYYINQGLAYRGGRLNKSDLDHVQIELTEEGKEVFLEDLGIKTEIDLRASYTKYQDKESGRMFDGAIDGLKYYSCSIDWHVANRMRKFGDTEIKNVFEILGNKDNYPVYFHCNIGTDRTGLIAYLLGNILGEKRDDLYCDYLFSNFGNINGSRPYTNLQSTVMTEYNDNLNAFSGDTMAIKTEHYLTEYCGVAQSCIDSIKSIFLTEKI